MVHLLHRLYGVDASEYMETFPVKTVDESYNGISLSRFARDCRQISRYVIALTMSAQVRAHAQWVTGARDDVTRVSTHKDHHESVVVRL